MIALIAIPVILIIVIAVILAKKKKTAPPKHSGGGEPGDHAHGASDMHTGAEAVNRVIDVQDGYGDGGDPYYGSPADTSAPQDADIRDEKEIREERDFRKRIGAIRDEYREERKRASEETEVWSEWKGYDDNDL